MPSVKLIGEMEIWGPGSCREVEKGKEDLEVGCLECNTSVKLIFYAADLIFGIKGNVIGVSFVINYDLHSIMTCSFCFCRIVFGTTCCECESQCKCSINSLSCCICWVLSLSQANATNCKYFRLHII